MPQDKPQVTIENPVINSPFRIPERHFKFTDDGITDVIEEGRRESSYFIPVAKPRGHGPQITLDTEWTEDRRKENEFINQIRRRVGPWRDSGYQGATITSTTRRLLEYWKNPDRDKPLYFCQIEALETAIYITEVAKKLNDAWIDNQLVAANKAGNSDLYRIAFKMATGSGKTIVMAMLIAWQTLNKLANPTDSRFSDAFLIITPGITIKDRLRVLLPNDSENYYRKLDVVPSDLMEELTKVKVVITNFHAFKLRDKFDAGKLAKVILKNDKSGALTETPDQMVRRVCRELGNKKNLVVINDEAHHCYRRKEEDEIVEVYKGEVRKEIEKREEEARIWLNGLEAVKTKIGIRNVYDLSATPFFLRGSGYDEGTLFPWVVSDFSLIDAIEAGIVKVPRVPVEDNTNPGQMPTYRNLWLNVRDDLPKKGRRTDNITGEPKMPAKLESAILSLYKNYEKSYALWKDNTAARDKGLTPPVFIVICNNTNVSKLVYDYISGWEKEIKKDTKVLVPGKLELFSNVQDGQWSNRPNTILVDSEQLESGESMSADFKQAVAVEIEEFKQEYRQRFPGRDTEKLTDEDLLREVMNTVGKTGKLGEQIKCVVSVSMLTEGWDATTVTHILGIRAFGTQLLCEQVVGRGLRRMSRAIVTHEHTVNGAKVQVESYPVEYAEVYGVPFSFIPCAGAAMKITIGVVPTRVRALDERKACEITFPRLSGYRFELPEERLTAKFDQESILPLSTQILPTRTVNAPIVGEKVVLHINDLKENREQEVVFLLAKHLQERYFKDDDGNLKLHLFPQLLDITRHWLDECLVLKDDTFVQLLLLVELADAAVGKIYNAIVSSVAGEKVIKPILKSYDQMGTTSYVDFDTTKPVWSTRADKCHLSHVVADTKDWEQKLAQALEELDVVIHYVKNHGLSFHIPYIYLGEEHNYMPDYIVHVDDGHGKDDLLTLIIEVTGEKKADKAVKVATARNLWVPAVNNHGGFGRWAFLEVDDPWNAKTIINGYINGKA